MMSTPASRALGNVVDKAKSDHNVVAAVVFGSLVNDEVWGSTT